MHLNGGTQHRHPSSDGRGVRMTTFICRQPSKRYVASRAGAEACIASAQQRRSRAAHG